MLHDRQKVVIARLEGWAQNPATAPPVKIWPRAFLDLEMPDGEVVEGSGPACRCSMHMNGRNNPCISTHVQYTSIKNGRDAARFMHEVFDANGRRVAILCAQCGMGLERALQERNPQGLTVRYIGDVLAEEARWRKDPDLYMRAVNARLLTDEEADRWMARVNKAARPSSGRSNGVPPEAPEKSAASEHLLSA